LIFVAIPANAEPTRFCSKEAADLRPFGKTKAVRGAIEKHNQKLQN
jgi:hypothetical protein